ncbi:MAG: B-box zinc finger protein, partial [Candidatus Acidiferrum sp.]
AAVSCPICEKRKAERFCPAKGEKICAVCCGKEREVSIDCPPDCSYLIAAHRYEDQHQRALPEDAPLLDVKVSQDLIYTHQDALSGLAFALAAYSAANRGVTDADVLAALQALAETYRTLESGIIYEKPPDAPVPRELYIALGKTLNEAKEHSGQRSSSSAFAGPAPIKDSEIFSLLVFLYRMGLLRTNGRPRSRRFLEFLRGQFPVDPELTRQESRIIVP